MTTPPFFEIFDDTDFRPGRATRTSLSAHRAPSRIAGAPSPAGASPAADATGPGRAALASAAGTSWPAASGGAAGLMPAAPRWEDGPPPEVGTGVPRLDVPVHRCVCGVPLARRGESWAHNFGLPADHTPRPRPLRAGGDPVPVRPRLAVAPRSRGPEAAVYRVRRPVRAIWVLSVLGVLAVLAMPAAAWVRPSYGPLATMTLLGLALIGGGCLMVAGMLRDARLESRPGGPR